MDTDKLKLDVDELKIRMAVAESKIEKIEDRLDKILSNTTWIIRTVIGAIVLTVLNFLYTGGF